nr:hypothetical protein [uncultured Mediterraneibacter sp.]
MTVVDYVKNKYDATLSDEDLIFIIDTYKHIKRYNEMPIIPYMDKSQHPQLEILVNLVNEYLENNGDLLLLGVVSRDVLDRQRITELKEAIMKYCECNKSICFEWVKEYNEICRRLEE